jgi:hypothetical protein
MKLNFWQWLGIVLLVIGVVWLIYGNWGKGSGGDPRIAPTTQSAGG